MVFCIVHHIPPFHYVIMEGRHIHHLVFGIFILLVAGYGWLCEVGNGSDSSSIFASSLMSLLYGLGAALTPSCPLLGYWRSVSVPSTA